MNEQTQILILDTNPHRLRANARLLTAAGYDVQTVATGSEALRLLSDQQPAVVLLAASPPDMDGLELCRCIKANARFADCSILVCADETTPGHQAKALAAGADDYLTCPVPGRELLARVEGWERQHQTRRSLRESEERFRALFENPSDLVSVIGPDGAVHYTSPSHQPILGYSPEELIGQMMLEFVHPEDVSQLVDILADLVRRPGGTAAATFRFRHRDGSWHWLEATGRNLLDNPAIGGIVSSSRDVTRRVWALQEIENSQRRERVLNNLLRIAMSSASMVEQLDQALAEILSIPWLPVLRQGAIFLVEDDPGVLVLQVSQGLGAALQIACGRVGFGQCLCGRAAASGEIQFATGVDDRHEIEYEGMATHGHYCVPILSKAQVVGTLVLYLAEGHPCDAQEEAFLQAIAHSLAALIEHKQAEVQLEDYSRNLERKVEARTHEIEQRRQVAESLRGILALLNSDRPPAEILDHIVAEARRLLGGDSSAIYQAGPAGEFHLQTAQGRMVELLADLRFPLDLRQSLRAGQPMVICDVDAAFPDEPAAEGPDADLAGCCHALLAVPLQFGGEVYGCLAVYYAEVRTFRDEEIELAVAFADQAALALENARLHHRAREAAVLEERARLARNLHDSVTQQLYSLTLLAEGWRRLSAAGRLPDVDQPLAELGEIARQALKEMRLLVYELRPPDLERLGLRAALEMRLAAVERRAGVEAHLQVDEFGDLPPAVQEELFRIAVEALNNALKHAGAASVTVVLRAAGNRLELEVADDGSGFDPLATTAGLGLETMRERAENLGGELAIHSAPGAGTRVTVSLEKGTTANA
jgi:PAS domain S-box-containing protein